MPLPPKRDPLFGVARALESFRLLNEILAERKSPQSRAERASMERERLESGTAAGYDPTDPTRPEFDPIEMIAAGRDALPQPAAPFNVGIPWQWTGKLETGATPGLPNRAGQVADASRAANLARLGGVSSSSTALRGFKAAGVEAVSAPESRSFTASQTTSGRTIAKRKRKASPSRSVFGALGGEVSSLG